MLRLSISEMRYMRREMDVPCGFESTTIATNRVKSYLNRRRLRA